jgi:hypothetical protein
MSDEWQWSEPERVSPDDPIVHGTRWRRERDAARRQLEVAVDRLEQIAAFEVDPDDGWDYSVGVMRAMAADALDRLEKAEAR